MLLEKYLGKYYALLETQNKCTKNKKMVSQVGGLYFLHLPLILSTVIWPPQLYSGPTILAPQAPTASLHLYSCLDTGDFESRSFSLLEITGLFPNKFALYERKWKLTSLGNKLQICSLHKALCLRGLWLCSNQPVYKYHQHISKLSLWWALWPIPSLTLLS